MNPGQDASPRSPHAEIANDDAETDLDPDIDTESLQRSRDAIDEGREAAREALKNEADLTSGTPEEPPSVAEETGAG